MNKTRLNGIFVMISLVLLSTSVLAIDIRYESSMVGRMAGDNPNDLARQLTNAEIRPKSAHVYNDGSKWSDMDNIIKGISHESTFYGWYDSTPNGGFRSQLSGIKSNDIVMANFEISNVDNTFVIYKAYNQRFNVHQMGEWVEDISNKQPIFLLNAPYAGLHLPGQITPATYLSSETVMIAPTAYSDPRFVQSFICNLNPDRTIGKAFMQARNSFYDHAGVDGSGLLLQSYNLLANPLRKVDFNYYNVNQVKSRCENEFEYEIETDIFSSSITDPKQAINEPQTITIVMPVNYNGATKVNNTDYVLLDVDGSFFKEADYELALPYLKSDTELPYLAKIMDLSDPQFLNEENLFLTGLPSWENGKYINRTCNYLEQELGVEQKITTNEDEVTLNSDIMPVDVINCEEGQITLPEEVRFDVTFVPNSPVHTKEVILEDNYIPSSQGTIQVNLKNLINLDFSGNLRIKYGDKVLGESQISMGEDATFNITFTVPDAEGEHELLLEFIFDNKTTARKHLTINAYNFLPKLSAYCSADKIVAELVTENNYDTEVQMDIEKFLYREDTPVTNETLIETAPTGKTALLLEFKDYDRGKGFYNILVDLRVNDKKFSLSDTCQVNLGPELGSISNFELLEGEDFTFYLDTVDVDNDDLAVTVDNPNIQIVNSSLQINSASFELDSINEINVTISDSYLSDSKTFNLTILPNQEPRLYTSYKESYTVTEEVIIEAYVSDDSSNIEFTINDPKFTTPICGTSDNLTCSIGYCELDDFDSDTSPGECVVDNGKLYKISNPEIGVQNIKVTVHDGMYEDSEDINITIIKDNHEPIILNATDLTVLEGDLATITIDAIDPDRDELYYLITGDQFDIGQDCGGIEGLTCPAKQHCVKDNSEGYDSLGKCYSEDNEFSWQTKEGDNGTHGFIVAASDGELENSRLVTVTVNKESDPGLCTSDNDCGTNEFCERNGCSDYTGTCQDKGGLCFDLYEPVCGCDGQTYSNDCYRQTDGISKDYDGACNVTPKTKPPVLKPIADINSTEWDLITIKAEATDEDSNELYYNVNDSKFGTGRPCGGFAGLKCADNQKCILDDSDASDSLGTCYSKDATLTWQTENGDAGTTNVKVTVSDGELEDSQELSITVSEDDSISSDNQINYIKGQIQMLEGPAPAGTKYNLTLTSGNNTGFVYQGEVDNEYIPGFLLGEGFFWTYDQIEFNTGDEYQIDIENCLRTTTGTFQNGGNGDFKDPVNINCGKGLLIEQIPKITVEETQDVKIEVDAVSLAKKPLTYTIDSDKFTQENNIFTWKTTYDDAGDYTFNILVQDGDSNETVQVNVTMIDINRKPRIDSTNPGISKVTITETDELLFTVNARDPDGDKMTYGWYYNHDYVGNESSYNLQTDYDSYGLNSMDLIIGDGQANTTYFWSVNILNKNRLPAFVPTVNSDYTVSENELVTITVSATDADGDHVEYFLEDSRFAKNNNQFTWQTDYFSAGTYTLEVIAFDGQDSAMNPINLTVYNVNRIPVIVSYSPQGGSQIQETETQTFSVTVTDADNETLEYKWYLDNERQSEEASSYDFKTDYDSEGPYDVRVTITDGIDTIERAWNLTVNNKNRAPVLEDIGNIHVNETELVTIAHFANDPDGDNLTYSIDDDRFTKNNNVFTWQTGYDDSGIYVVKITANDGDLTDSQEVTIIVDHVSRPPVLNLIQDITVDETELVVITPRGTDPDGDRLSFKINGSRFEELDGLFGWQTTYDDAGTYTITVTTTDGNLSDSQEVTITVNNVNRAPSVPSSLTPNKGTFDNELTIICGGSTDADEEKVTYKLDASYNNDWNSVSNVFDTSSIPNQEIDLRCKSTDGDLESDWFNPAGTLTIFHDADKDTITDTEDICPQTPSTETANSEGCSCSQVQIDDHNLCTDDSCESGIISNINNNELYPDITTCDTDKCEGENFIDYPESGYSYCQEGELKQYSCTPTSTYSTDCDQDDDNDGDLDETDCAPKDANIFHNNPDLLNNCVNDRPILNNIDDITIDETELVVITPTGSDPDNDKLTFRIEDSRFKELDGLFGWQTTYDDAGIHKITATTSDGELEDSQEVTITVNQVNREPVLSTIQDFTVNENELVTITPQATDADDDTIIYKINNTKFTKNNDIFTWTPTYDDSGIYNFELTASDNKEPVKTQFTITVNHVNRPPEFISDKTTFTTDEGVELLIRDLAIDPDGDKLSYVTRDERFKTWQDTLSWTPGFLDSGESIVKLWISDGQFVIKRDLIINVTDVNQPPTTPSSFTADDDGKGRLDVSCGGSTDIDEDEIHYEIEAYYNDRWNDIVHDFVNLDQSQEEFSGYRGIRTRRPLTQSFVPQKNNLYLVNLGAACSSGFKLSIINADNVVVHTQDIPGTTSNKYEIILKPILELVPGKEYQMELDVLPATTDCKFQHSLTDSYNGGELTQRSNPYNGLHDLYFKTYDWNYNDGSNFEYDISGIAENEVNLRCRAVAGEKAGEWKEYQTTKEGEDADSDSVANELDLCPKTPENEIANNEGCSCSQLTVNDDNLCTTDICEFGIVTHTNNDEHSDELTICESDRCDHNNYVDYPESGYAICSHGELRPYSCEPTIAISDNCATDQDNDGVNDDADKCSDTPETEMTNDDGCSCSQLDINDGNMCTDDSCTEGIISHEYNNDLSPDLTFCAVDECDGESLIDYPESGYAQCSEGELKEYSCAPTATYNTDCDTDKDNDGVTDALDKCSDTPETEMTNDDGCSCSQLDIDDDNMCTDDSCTSGIISHEYNNDLSPDLTTCAVDECDGESLIDYPESGYAQCSEGELNEYSCVPTTSYSSICDNDDDEDGDPDETDCEPTNPEVYNNNEDLLKNCVNDPPVVVHFGPKTVKKGTDVTVLISATDPEGDRLTYKSDSRFLKNSDDLSNKFTGTATEKENKATITVSDGESNTKTEVIYLTNSIPIANAGEDQTVEVGRIVILDAMNSLDPDGDALTYFWSQLEGPDVTLSSLTDRRTTFTAPDTEYLLFKLVVNDGQLDSIPDTIRIKVSSCQDEDDRDYFTKGTTTFGSNTKTDYCDGDLVTEYYCEVGFIKDTNHKCENGCSNGRCLGNDSITITSFTPDSPVSVKELQSLEFTVLVNSVNRVKYSWYVDDSLVGFEDSYTYSPTITASGDHKISVKVSDDYNTKTQSWDVKVIELVVEDKPDLIVNLLQRIGNSPLYPTNQYIWYEYSILNQGPLSANNVVTRIDLGDGTIYNFPTSIIKPGDTFSGKIPHKWTKTGGYIVKVIADPDNIVKELDESNNIETRGQQIQ